MSFLTTIPQPSDFWIQSGPQLRNNFNSIFTGFAQDHYPMTADNPNTGMHRSLTLANQASDPVTAADQIAIYNKTGTGTLPQLFYAPEGAATPIQLTYQNIVNTGNDQYSFVAGPFIFYFGIVNGAVDGQTKTLSPATTLISVVLTCTGPKKPVDVITSAKPIISGSGFKIRLTATNTFVVNVSYVAIGVI